MHVMIGIAIEKNINQCNNGSELHISETVLVLTKICYHGDVFRWEHFLRYWSVTGHRWIPLTKARDAEHSRWYMPGIARALLVHE